MLFLQTSQSIDWPVFLQLDLLVRLILAAILGGIIGYEREVSGKPAGLRTNLLICVGSALFTELSMGVAFEANLRNLEEGVEFRADPARIAAQIVSGIGFLGAGTILQARGHVIGLTTAATIWVVASIGMAVGAQAYVMAVGGTALVYLSLAMLTRVERRVEQRRSSNRYLVTLEPQPEVLSAVEAEFRTGSLQVMTVSIDKSGDHYEVIFAVSGHTRDLEEVIRILVSRDDVFRISRVA